MPLVSVLLPAYNSEAYLEAARASIEAQTLRDWEVIAVDDASSDRTFEILTAWSGSNSRVRAFRNSTNLGMTGNWNRCLSHAAGDLVIKLDADDAFRPGALETLVRAVRSEDVLGAGVRTLACTEALEPFDGLPTDDAMMRAGVDPYQDQVLDNSRWYAIAAQGHQLWHSCAVMVPRTLLSELHGYDERFGCASDTDLIWRLLERPGRFAHRAEVGVLYRMRGGSVSDLFRSNRWLTWEGQVGNLASLSRWRQSHRLSRFLRMRYVELWKAWRHAGSDSLPPEIRQRLQSVASGASPPPLSDRALWSTRQAVTKLPV